MYIVYIQQLMNIFRLFDLNNICCLCLFLLNDLTRRVWGIGAKNYLKYIFKEFLAVIDTKNKVFNHSKVFCLFFLKVIASVLMAEKDSALLDYMDITKERPKYILFSELHKVPKSYVARDSIYIRDNYCVINKCNELQVVLYQRKDN